MRDKSRATTWFREVCLAVAAQAQSPRLREAAAGMEQVVAGGGAIVEAHDRHDLFGSFVRGFSTDDLYATWALTEARFVAQRVQAGELWKGGFGVDGYVYLSGRAGMSLPALPEEFAFPVV